jgi:hypothetical protein
MKEKKITPRSILTSILPDDIQNASLRLKKVRQITSESFLLPELDGPRREICNCYVIGAYSACITLTNHLLERYCKELLLTVEFGNPFLRAGSSSNKTAPPDLSQYLNKDLSATLSACKTKGLLSKQDWKIFDKYKEIFRNGFSHYDPPKILQGGTYGFSLLGVDGATTEVKGIKIQDGSMAALAINMFAERNAWPYLATVENFMRSTIRYFHNPKIDPGLPTVPYE